MKIGVMKRVVILEIVGWAVNWVNAKYPAASWTHGDTKQPIIGLPAESINRLCEYNFIYLLRITVCLSLPWRALTDNTTICELPVT